MKKPRENSFANELGRLEHGMGKRVKDTATVFFIHYDDIPSECQKYIAYGRIVIDYHPQKDEPNCSQLEVGGDLIDYPGDVRTPTANTTTDKNVWNSVTSTPKAKDMCINTNNF